MNKPIQYCSVCGSELIGECVPAETRISFYGFHGPIYYKAYSKTTGKKKYIWIMRCPYRVLLNKNWFGVEEYNNHDFEEIGPVAEE